MDNVTSTTVWPSTITSYGNDTKGSTTDNPLTNNTVGSTLQTITQTFLSTDEFQNMTASVHVSERTSNDGFTSATHSFSKNASTRLNPSTSTTAISLTTLLDFNETTMYNVSNSSGTIPEEGSIYGVPTFTLVLTHSIPVLFLLSVFGNVVIILVMNRERNKKLASSVLFTALAVSDILLVTQASAERWFDVVLHVSPFASEEPSTGAKIKVMLTYANLHVSTWILVAITGERVLCVTIPHKVRLFCTLNVCRIVVAAIVAVSLVLNIVLIETVFNVIFIPEIGPITFDKFENAMDIHVNVDLVYGFVLPFSLICIGSIIIVVTIARSMSVSSSNKNDRTRSVTTTVIFTNLTFIVTVSPFRIFSMVVADKPYIPVYDTLFPLFMYIGELNACLNFYVYVLSGARFREDAKAVLFCKTTKPKASSSRITNTTGSSKSVVTNARKRSADEK